MGHYEELGVAPSATHDEIKQAYHRQARRHHPDAHSQASPAIQASARRRMVEINAAWAVLGDPDLRRDYDAEIGPPRRAAGPTPTEANGRRRGEGPRRSEEDGVGAPSGAAKPPANPPPGFPDWFNPDEAVPAAHLEEDLAEGPPGRGELLVFVPVGLAALAVVTFAFALVVQWPALFVVSFALVPLALVSFLAAPFVAMATRVRSSPADD